MLLFIWKLKLKGKVISTKCGVEFGWNSHWSFQIPRCEKFKGFKKKKKQVSVKCVILELQI